jgi:hypothetical protein
MEGFSSVRRFLEFYLGSPGLLVPFGGRQRELSMLDQWLDNNTQAPYLFLVAPAGCGKSALLARWVAGLLQRQDVNLLYFPISVRFSTNQAEEIFSSLASRLAFLAGEVLDLKAAGGLRYWMGLFSDYLQKQPKDKKTLLVLDGLDESAGWPWREVFLPLAPERSRLRVVLAARTRVGEQYDHTWERELGLEFAPLGLTKRVSLEVLSLDGLRDVLVQMREPLNSLAQKEEIVQELYRLTENGDPLLVRLFVDALWPEREGSTALTVEDLKKLQPGLVGYFRRWWEDQEKLWQQSGSAEAIPGNQILALLRLFALARGPLRTKDLGSLNNKLQIFPNVKNFKKVLSRLISGEENNGFTLAHSRLSIFFLEEWKQKWKEEHWDSDEGWYEEIKSLEQGFLEWGKETLQNLVQGTLVPDNVPPYLVRYYRVHLEAAIASLTERSALACPAWFRAWEVLGGGFSGFLNDLGAIHEAIQDANTKAVESGKEAPYIGEEIRGVLCAASLRSLVGELPGSLLIALVEKKIWTLTQAWATARQQPIITLVNTVDYFVLHSSPEEKDHIVREAFELIRNTQDEHLRARALRTLAPLLSRELLQEVMSLVRKFRHENSRVFAWEVLLIYFSPEERSKIVREVLDSVQGIQEEHLRAGTLRRILPHTPPEFLSEALGLARQIQRESDRVLVLGALMPQIPEKDRAGIIDEAFAELQQIRNIDAYSEAICAIALYLPAGLVPQALSSVQQFQDEPPDTNASKPKTPDNEQSSVFIQRLTLVMDSQPEQARVSALVALLPRLSPEKQPEIIREAFSLVQQAREEHIRMNAFGDIAPYLLPELLPDALIFSQQFKNIEYRVSVLGALIPRLPTEKHAKIIHEAFLLVKQIRDQHNRSQALDKIAQYLPPELLLEALVTVRQFQDGKARVYLLEKFIPYLSTEERSSLFNEVLALARDTKDELRGTVVATFAQHFSPEFLPEAIVLAKQLRDKYPLWQLLPYLSEPKRNEVVRDIFSLLSGEQDGKHIENTLRGIARYPLPELLSESVSLARQFPDSSRALILGGIVSHLPVEQRPEIIQEIFGAVQKIQDESVRASTRETLVIYLTPKFLREVLTLIPQIKDEYRRMSRLVEIAPYIPRELLPEALPLIEQIPDRSSRALALAKIGRHLSTSEYDGRIREAINSVLVDPDELYRTSAIGGLASYFAPELLPQALKSVRQTQDVFRAGALSGIALQAKKCNEGLLLEMVPDWLALPEKNWSHFPGEAFRDLPRSVLYAFLIQILSLQSSSTREVVYSILRQFVPLLVPLGGALTPGKVLQAIIDTSDGWS